MYNYIQLYIHSNFAYTFVKWDTEFIIISSFQVLGLRANHKPLHMPSASIVIGELVQGSESPSLFTANTLQEKANNVLKHSKKSLVAKYRTSRQP